MSKKEDPEEQKRQLLASFIAEWAGVVDRRQDGDCLIHWEVFGFLLWPKRGGFGGFHQIAVPGKRIPKTVVAAAGGERGLLVKLDHRMGHGVASLDTSGRRRLVEGPDFDTDIEVPGLGIQAEAEVLLNRQAAGECQRRLPFG